TSCSLTKWNWTFCRVVMWPKPREQRSPTSASASSCSLVRTPCGIFTRSICASSACRWPYVPRTSRNARHWSGVSSPRSYRSSVATNSSMSATLANESRARPNVLGSSTTDMGFLRVTHLNVANREARIAPQTDRDDIADDDGAGTAAVDLDGICRKLVQRAAPHLLIRPRRVNDDGRWRSARPAVVDEPARTGRRSPESHQDDDGEAVRTQRADCRGERRVFVRRHDQERRRDTAVRHRNPRRRRCGDGAADPGHDVIGDA